MKGDFSRLTFDPQKHYSSVRMQQGRVQLDADWNEQIEIQAYQHRTAAMDTIGPSGVPQLGGGFEILTVGQDLAISAGRIYVDGILCELEASPLPIESFSQPNQVRLPDLVVDGRRLDAGQWVEISMGKEPPTQVQVTAMDPDGRTLTLSSEIKDALRGSFAELRRVTTFYTQADLPLGEDANFADGIYLVYLDVWPRHVSALEDPTIREVALGGADTATRVRTTWQVKRLPLESRPDGRGDIPEWETLVQPTLGRLAVKPAPSLYLTENQLYRIEVHTGSEGETTSFKWSRDNGSVVAKVSAPIAAESITIEDMGRDPSTAFVPGKWIEISSREWELQGRRGICVRLVDLVGQTLTFDASTLDQGERLPTFSPTGLLTVRQWEDEPQPIGEGVNLGNGIVLTFSEGTYRGGDYWLAPVRAADNSIEWPQDSQGNPQPQAPHGVQHHCSKLALAELKDGQWSVLEDYRFIFSSLSQLKALNVIGAAINAPDDAIYVDEDGRVGIGTRTPQDALHVRDGALLVESSRGVDFRPMGFVALGELKEPVYGLGVDDLVFIHRRTSRVSDIGIYDLSDPRRPQELSSISARLIQDVVISGKTAYIATLNSVEIYDVSTPAKPKPIASYSIQPGEVQGISVSGHLAYISTFVPEDGTVALEIVDVSDPPNPERKGVFSDTQAGFGKVAVSGDFAYVMEAEAQNEEARGLRIIAVSDPTAPEPAGSYLVQEDRIRDFVVADEYVVVATDSEVQFVDVSNADGILDANRVKGRFSVDLHDSQKARVTVSGNRVFLLTDHAVQVLDFGEPAKPVVIGSYSVPANYDTIVSTVFSGSSVYLLTQRIVQAVVYQAHFIAVVKPAARIGAGGSYFYGSVDIGTSKATIPERIKLRVDGGDVQFDGALSVKGETNLEGDLTVSGDVRLGSTHLVYNSADGVIDWGSGSNGDLYFRALGTQGDVNSYTNRMTIQNNGSVWISGGILVNDERNLGEFVPGEVPEGVSFRFKNWREVSIPRGTREDWCSVITIRPYPDLTATIHQLAFCDDGIFWRRNAGPNRAWQPWVQITRS